jgi:hypothetical protein
MTIDPANLLLLLLSVGVAFFISRFIATRWRARRRDHADNAARDGESRQVRRARERERRRRS